MSFHYGAYPKSGLRETIDFYLPIDREMLLDSGIKAEDVP